MKRTAAFLMVAGVAGTAGLTGCVTPSARTTDATPMPMAAKGGMTRDGMTMPAGGMTKATRTADGTMIDPGLQRVSGYDAAGPAQRGVGNLLGHGGILPAPGMGPPGAVALVPGAAVGPNAGMYANGRTSIRFVSPAGMKIAFQNATGMFAESGREAPVRYNFVQGSIYRVRVSGIANKPGKTYYPTLEVYPGTAKTVEFLSHSTVPVGFTDEDFEQVNSGNLVVKVIYLPDAAFQDVTAAEEIVSTRLDPGVDPVVEANRRGTILAVIRVGNIDLEDPTTPPVDAPPPGMSMPKMSGPPTVMPAPVPPTAPSSSFDVPSANRAKMPASLPPINVPAPK